MKAPDLALIGFVAIIIIILAFAAVVLWQVWAGTIKLDGLIAELDPARPADYGKASLSRFQFLLFTFVVAGLFLLLSIETGAFIHVPGDARTDRDQQRHLRRLEGRVEPSEQT